MGVRLGLTALPVRRVTGRGIPLHSGKWPAAVVYVVLSCFCVRVTRLVSAMTSGVDIRTTGQFL